MVEERRAAKQRGKALQQQGRGGWSSGGRRVGGVIFDGVLAESRMGDVSGRKVVVRVGWRSIEGDMRFGLRVLLWRWRWLKAWEMSVFRCMYMPCGRFIERHGLLMWDHEYPWDEGDSMHKMMVRELQREGEYGGPMWKSIYGDLAWLGYKDFVREVWVYWRVEMWRAWEARFTPEGRKRRAEGRWRKDRKVGKVWWRWGRRKGGPPHYGYRERWWTWLAGVRGLMGIMEEGRLMWWGWMEWRRVVEGSRQWRAVEERQRQHRKQQRRGHQGTENPMMCSERWTCRICGTVLRMTAGCGDCAEAVRSTVKK